MAPRSTSRGLHSRAGCCCSACQPLAGVPGGKASMALLQWMSVTLQAHWSPDVRVIPQTAVPFHALRGLCFLSTFRLLRRTREAGSMPPAPACACDVLRIAAHLTCAFPLCYPTQDLPWHRPAKCQQQVSSSPAAGQQQSSSKPVLQMHPAEPYRMCSGGARRWKGDYWLAACEAEAALM